MEIAFKKYCRETLAENPSDNKEAFLILFEKFKNKVFSYSLHITHSETIAEDITQEVFIKVWLNINSLAEINNVEAWIITIARNLCFNQLKKQALEQKLSKFAIKNLEHANTGDSIIFKERLNEVNQIINNLPSQQRIIFNLNKMEGLKNEEIALQLNISVNTVKSHFTKAMNTVRRKLQTYPTILIFTFLLKKIFFPES